MRARGAQKLVAEMGRIAAEDPPVRPSTGPRPVDGVRLVRRGGVCLLLLDRPPANAYDHALLRELDARLDEARLDESIRGVVVAAASGRVFCAGADVAAFAASSQRGRAMTCSLAQEVFLKLERSPVRTVAAIAGDCLGGGLELALACRARLGARGRYRLGQPEVRIGLLPGSGGTQRLSRLIGLPLALDLVVTGRVFGPEEARQLGLLDRLLPDAQACLDAAVRLAEGAGKEDHS
jgi:enoyl-CoA hydratase/carnithine racemase